jgi:hypothetical protein
VTSRGVFSEKSTTRAGRLEGEMTLPRPPWWLWLMLSAAFFAAAVHRVVVIWEAGDWRVK